jgi:hypothetical protein
VVVVVLVEVVLVVVLVDVDVDVDVEVDVLVLVVGTTLDGGTTTSADPLPRSTVVAGLEVLVTPPGGRTPAGLDGVGTTASGASTAGTSSAPKSTAPAGVTAVSTGFAPVGTCVLGATSRRVVVVPGVRRSDRLFVLLESTVVAAGP